MNILFTSPGRRVELVETFRNNFPLKTKFFGTDYDSTSPASYFLDRVYKVPYKIDDKYAKRVLDICIDNDVKITIPLIDPELFYLAKYRDEFYKNGISLMISSFAKIKIAFDKLKTFRFLKKHNLPTPQTWLPSQLSEDIPNLPIIIKPRKGSSAKGIRILKSIEEFNSIIKIIDNDYIVQKYIYGYEVTVSIFGDEKGNCYEIVQRKRLKVRGGEIERGVTIKDPSIFQITKEFVEKYRPNGAINIQFIVNKDKYKILEINPRFGGGYPLAHHAGANFPQLILNTLLGKENKINVGNYTENLYMFRYDKAIYTKDLIKLC